MESDQTRDERDRNTEKERIEEVFFQIDSEFSNIGKSYRWSIGSELDDENGESEIALYNMIKFPNQCHLFLRIDLGFLLEHPESISSNRIE